jgi:hypothetical protein
VTGLIIDSSSPAVSVATLASNTCSAFTPPDSPLLLAAWAGDSKGNTDPPAAPVASSSPTQAWTRYNWDHRASGSPNVDGQTAFFAALVVGAPGSTTVTIANGETTQSYDSVLQVFVLTGADSLVPIGVGGSGRTNVASAISAFYTATITGGQGFMVVSDWDATDSTGWTPLSGCTILAKGTTAGISYAVIQRTTADGIVGQTTELGMSGLGGVGSFHYSFIEVISAEAAALAATNASNSAFGAMPHMF